MTEDRGRFAAIGRWAGSIRPSRGDLAGDVMAGLPGAIGSVPDGMANAVLVGVNPIHGLYASMIGRIVGGLSASTELLVITTTAAAGLAAGSALASADAEQRLGSLFLLTLMAGVFMLVAGLLRLGRYTRFVANSVMLGFVTGIAANVFLGQVTDLTGSEGAGSSAAASATVPSRLPSISYSWSPHPVRGYRRTPSASRHPARPSPGGEAGGRTRP